MESCLRFKIKFINITSTIFSQNASKTRKRKIINPGDSMSSSKTAIEEANEIINDPDKLRQVTNSTVNAVKTLLAATKDERTKRGKYVKYTSDLRDEIAEYAQKYGTFEASKHYSTTLGNPVAETTIRNFVKAYQLFSHDLKEQIGRHAYQFGLDACLKAKTINTRLPLSNPFM
jgi:hypothetical protein